jgi:hypothetical protein
LHVRLGKLLRRFKTFSSTAPVSNWRRRVRTIVAAPRAVGDAKKTSSTV